MEQALPRFSAEMTDRMTSWGSVARGLWAIATWIGLLWLVAIGAVIVVGWNALEALQLVKLMTFPHEWISIDTGDHTYPSVFGTAGAYAVAIAQWSAVGLAYGWLTHNWTRQRVFLVAPVIVAVTGACVLGIALASGAVIVGAVV